MPSIYWWSEQNLVYMANPKVANTAIWHGIRSQYGPPRKLQKETLLLMREPFTFSFVRNPYDRAVSMWADKLARKVTATEHILRQHPGFYVGMGFWEFIQQLSRTPNSERNPHFQYQWSTLSYDGKLIPDFVGRFENFQSDWMTAMRMHRGSDWHLVLDMENKSQHSWWEDYYTQKDAKAACYRAFQPDFEGFGYDK